MYNKYVIVYIMSPVGKFYCAAKAGTSAVGEGGRNNLF